MVSKNGWVLVAFLEVSSSMVYEMDLASGFTTTRSMRVNGKTT